VLYVDLIFLFNSAVDLLVLWLTATIRKQVICWWRLLLTAGIGGLYVIGYLIANSSIFYGFCGKMLVSFLMVFLAFGFTGFLAWWRNVLVFYLVSFLCSGVILGLKYAGLEKGEVLDNWRGPSISWTLVIVGFIFAWLYTRLSFKSLAERNAINEQLVQLRVSVMEKELLLTGLVDTGNQLRDPLSRRPVIVIEKKQLLKILPVDLMSILSHQATFNLSADVTARWFEKIRFIPYKVIGVNSGMLKALKPDQVYIMYQKRWKELHEVLIGVAMERLSTDGTYQALIPLDCLTFIKQDQAKQRLLVE
jgi:stage II sporulation protein GA (sporulation sigma-E factor processing peptidase)